MRAYCATSMTGRTGAELVEQAERTAWLAWCYDVEVFDPIVNEGVKADKNVLDGGGDKLREFWKRDKEAIRRCHVVIDVTGNRKSAGVECEVGYARYHLHKPVIRVWPNLGCSVARLEDDLVVDDLNQAFKLAVQMWGTPWKRLRWKWRIFKKSYWNLLKVRLIWFIDWR